MPDPRRAKGRRHPLAFVLALAACAVLAGAKSLTAIAEWAADAPAAVLTVLGGPSREPAGPTAPTEATVRRILQRVDGDALDAAIGAWLAARSPDRPPPDQDLGRHACRSLAVDGKTVRGARRTDGTQVHLPAAMTGTGLVTAQREVGSKTNEITVFKPMLAPLDLTDTVVTFDALHSQSGHARFLIEEKNTHYIAVIKGNQPLLHQQLKQLPWRDVPLLDETRATEHGRDEICRVKTCTKTRGLGFPTPSRRCRSCAAAGQSTARRGGPAGRSPGRATARRATASGCLVTEVEVVEQQDGADGVPAAVTQGPHHVVPGFGVPGNGVGAVRSGPGRPGIPEDLVGLGVLALRSGAQDGCAASCGRPGEELQQGGLAPLRTEAPQALPLHEPLGVELLQHAQLPVLPTLRVA
ncbi:ISAs1 family transposase [Streptomyces sp. NRRL WC-3742]|uniref:ISAs1 family transposase n=1 Tax=Streptomyces sp. NRRL WC-3742 TaxID=1463934 RepID=UPI0006922A8B|nr:ISAs1 family transposase [Streptomyces sp. NRRL WC-3742]